MILPLYVGPGGTVALNRILVVAAVDSAPIQRAIRQAEADRRLIDLTFGRRRRSAIFLDTGHIVLSALRPEKLVEQWKENSKSR